MLSIIVLSSDGYSDCWDPFFTLLTKYFPLAKNFETILSTNSKQYHNDNLNLRIINHNSGDSWSKRFKKCVKLADNDIILLLVEDDFLRSPIDLELFEQVLMQIKVDPDVDHVRFLSTFDRTEMTSNNKGSLQEIAPKTKLRLTFLPGLWRKDVLLKYLVDYEAPFLAEKNADFKSWIYKDGFYAISKEYVDKNGQFYDGMASGGIFRGKWASWVVPFFEKENIYMNYEIRGFATDDFRKTTRLKSRIEMIKDPLNTLKSILSLLGVFIKVKILRLNKKI